MTREAIFLRCLGVLLLSSLAAAVAGMPAWGQDAVADRTFALRIEGASREPQVLRAFKDERLRIEVRADRAIVVHIHGLGAEIVAAPGKPGDALVVAKATGRFPVQVHDPADPRVSAHHHRAPFAYVEVHPK